MTMRHWIAGALPTAMLTLYLTAVYAGAASGAAPAMPGDWLAGVPATGDSQVLAWAAGMAVLGIPALLLAVGRRHTVNRIASPGFEIITPSERRRFIPLTEKYQQLDFVAAVKTSGALRVSANLNRVNLSIRRSGYLMEDRNFRNALLVNRRRVRRTLLKDGDVLDLGDLTLLYRDNRPPPPPRAAQGDSNRDRKAIIKFERPSGPVRKNTPALIPEQHPNRVFFMSKNKIVIGYSEMNDLIVKAPNIQYRHAKIERIGGRFKLFNLAPGGATFVNNRRVEQRVLKEGDEIALDSQRFIFSFNHRSAREKPAQQSRSRPADAQRHGNDTEDQTIEEEAQASERE